MRGRSASISDTRVSKHCTVVALMTLTFLQVEPDPKSPIPKDTTGSLLSLCLGAWLRARGPVGVAELPSYHLMVTVIKVTVRLRRRLEPSEHLPWVPSWWSSQLRWRRHSRFP